MSKDGVDDAMNEVIRKAAQVSADGRKYDLRTSEVGGSSSPLVDPNNSTETPLNNGQVFTGAWTERTTPEMIMSFSSDQSFTWVAQFSTDGINIDSSLPYTYTAGAINVPRRLVIARKYYRVIITNDSGSNMTYLRAQTSIGKYDALASKLNAALSVDADAEVVRAIQAGQQPDGDYVNVRADGGAVDVNSVDVFTDTLLSAAASYVSGWCDTDGFTSIEISIQADQISADQGIIVEYTNDANIATPLVELTKTFEFNQASVDLGDLTILIPPRLDGFRITYTNGSVDQGDFFLSSTLRTQPVQSVELPISSEINKNTNANITRTVSAGETPNGDFLNNPQSGVFTDGSSVANLAAFGEFQGEWFDASRYANIQIFIQSDQAFDDTAYTDSFGVTGGILFEIRQGDTGAADYSFVISPATNPPFHYLKTKPLLKWSRLSYTNGATIQTKFRISMIPEINASPAPITTVGAAMGLGTLAETTRSVMFGKTDTNSIEAIPLINAGTEITNAQQTVVTKSVLVVEDAAGDYGRLHRVGEALKVSDENLLSGDVSRRPNSAFVTQQINVIPGAPIIVPRPSALIVSNPKKIRITNPDTTNGIYFGRDNGLTVLNGDFIFPRTAEMLDIGDDSVNSKQADDIYLLGEGAAATTQDDDLNADTVDSSTATNASNMYSSNDSRAVFDAQSENATLSGFDATGASLLADIVSVKLKMEGRKEPSAGAETSSFVDVVGQDAGNVTSIASPTVTANADHFYVVAISRRDEFATITQINNTMGFTGFTLIGDTGTSSAESRTSVYYMTGTPTGNGTITASFSQGADHCVISVTRFSNIKKSNPIGAVTTFGTNNSLGAYSGSISSGTNQGQYYIAVGMEQGSHVAATTPSGVAERFEDGSTAGNDQSQAVSTATLTATGTVNFSGTISGTADLTYVAVSLNPNDAIDPVITISHSEGASTLVANLSSESDTNFETDITIDATWSTALIDSMTITVTATTLSSANAEIDHAYVEVVTSSSTIRACVSWMGDKP